MNSYIPICFANLCTLPFYCLSEKAHGADSFFRNWCLVIFSINLLPLIKSCYTTQSPQENICCLRRSESLSFIDGTMLLKETSCFAISSENMRLRSRFPYGILQYISYVSVEVARYSTGKPTGFANAGSACDMGMCPWYSVWISYFKFSSSPLWDRQVPYWMFISSEWTEIFTELW